jgi:hypothetical protein
MTDPGGAPRGESEPPRSRRGAGYVHRLHVEFIVLLAIITVVFAYLGWTWRPQSSGFPAIPQGLTVQVEGGVDVAAREVLTRTGDDSATLDLFLDAEPVGDLALWSERTWSVTIWNLDAGRVCTPGTYVDKEAAAVASGIHQTVTRTSQHRVVVHGSGFPAYSDGPQGRAAWIRLCWDAKAPVQLNGSYLAARFPPIAGYAPLTIGTPSADINATVARTLHPDAETSDFAIQSQPRPTSAGPDAWTWASQSSDQPIQLSAIDVSDTQHADYLTFLSGIAFGLAGAAVIALLGEFILPLHQRRQDREDRA